METEITVELNSQHQTQLSRLKQANDEYKLKIAALEKEHEESCEQLKKERDALAAQLHEANATQLEYVKLKQEFDTLTDAHQKKQQDLDKIKKLAHVLKTQNQKLQQEKSSTEDAAKKLEQVQLELAQLQQTYNDLQTKWEHEKGEWNKREEETRQTLAQYQNKEKTSEESKHEYVSKYEALRQSMEETNNTLTQVTKERDQYQKEVQLLQESIANLKLEWEKQKTEDIQNLKQKYKDVLNQNKANWKQKTEQMTQRLNEQITQLQSQKQDVCPTSSLLLEKQIQGIRESTEQKEKEWSDYKETNTESERTIQLLQQQLEQLKEDKQDTDSQNKVLQEIIKNHEQDQTAGKSNWEDEKNKHTNEIKTLLEQIEHLRTEKFDIETKHSKLMIEHKDLQFCSFLQFVLCPFIFQTFPSFKRLLFFQYTY
ncbi:hypothetical protein RFI_23660, partial [Reticulomyxa filosa]